MGNAVQSSQKQLFFQPTNGGLESKCLPRLAMSSSPRLRVLSLQEQGRKQTLCRVASKRTGALYGGCGELVLPVSDKPVAIDGCIRFRRIYGSPALCFQSLAVPS